MTSYEVTVWKTTSYHGKRKTTYYVRWKVARAEFRSAFKTSALADSFRSELVAAANKGEPFDITTGLPVSKLHKKATTSDWFSFAREYMKMKWDDASPKHRRGISEALTNITSALLAQGRGKPDSELLRRTCNIAFNINLGNSTVDEIMSTMSWLERNTRPVSDLGEPDVMRAIIKAIGSKLDGTKAATSTTLRKRMTLLNALDYAVEKKLLTTNPLTESKIASKKKPPAIREVDKRSVINPMQARMLLSAVTQLKPSGPRLRAFFGSMYYSALRPEEAAALRRQDLSLPPAQQNPDTGEWEFADGIDGWGQMHLGRARPEVAAEWTDSNSRDEERGLKHRDPSEGRTVPCPPALTLLFYAHLAEFGTAPDGRLFRGVRNDGRVPSTVYGRTWAKARGAVFNEEVAASPLGKRPYDLRHAAVSTWIMAGIEIPRVAEWAGHSIAVLLKVYAKFIDGGEQTAHAKVDRALGG